MNIAPDSLAALYRLPIGAADGRLGFYVLDADGEVLLHRGFDDGLASRFGSVDWVDRLPAGRQWHLRPLGTDGVRLLTTFDDQGPDVVEVALDVMGHLASEWLRVEAELDQISPSSLALMEEVAMMHELTSRLPGCANVSEVVRLALEELMVAAEAERGYYVAFDRTATQGEIVVALRFGPESRRSVVCGNSTGRTFLLADGLLERVASRRGGSIIEVVGDSPLGPPGSPESAARREALAAPVAYGDGDGGRTIGAIVLCDKRGDTHRAFGSQESKMATAVASLVGGAIGHRLVAALGKEMELAHEIHRQILPDRIATVPGFDIAGACETSGAVGGDYFDLVAMGDGRTLVVVADVSGHNLASGMVMVGVRSTLRVIAGNAADTAGVFEGLLESTFDDLQRTELFVTAAAIALQPDRDAIEVVSAGHNDVFIWRHADGAVERLPSVGAVFGFRRDEDYAPMVRTLAAGDVAVLYTDGLVEARNPRGEMFGDHRLAGLLSSCRDHTADQILSSLQDAVSRFSGREDPEDDITAVVIRRLSAVAESGEGGTR